MTAIPAPIRKSLGAAAAEALLEEIAGVVAAAPLFRPVLPRWGTPFSVMMSNCGTLGWVSDKSGYRYQPRHPATDAPWPAMPASLLDIWSSVTDYRFPPEACLINYYARGAKMGLHQDRDEADFSAPVVSVSLGDTARFRLGGVTRDAPATTFDLVSGDVMSLAGETRLAFHGIDRVFAGSSELLLRHPGLFASGGRLNLTMRRVTQPDI